MVWAKKGALWKGLRQTVYRPFTGAVMALAPVVVSRVTTETGALHVVPCTVDVS